MNNKYFDEIPYLHKSTYKQDFIELEPKKKQKKATKKVDRKSLHGESWFNMKPTFITNSAKEEVFKIANRDILLNNGMEKVELGPVFQLGKFKNSRKTDIDKFI
ncbi:hypothetical protein EDEG_02043 [Edhazardia aedis USNM 41457]|uniref:Uncharacterized protein n=1 Tax=Edhazardia aedis (strain USNM 41457) TaxID=1003232 RepID=J9D793_EDHAE|nr:hypothetical protein EDEG_02043 [Edhazardia aedis USNM 41457]|eukprot:EJW03646.1 hypothetical protein EDEG_02043 [Edhazardia aedis USNM 41457]